MVLIHYGVKGMKWNQNLMAQEYVPVKRRPRAREKNVSEGAGKEGSIYRREAVNTDNKPVGVSGSRPTQVKVVGTSPSGKKQVVVQNASNSSTAETKKKTNEYDTTQAKEERKKEAIARVNGNAGTGKATEEKEEKGEKKTKKETKKTGSRSKSSVSRKSSTKKKINTNSKQEDSEELTELDDIALKAIRGDFGNGEARKKALGDNYAQIQARVNELLKIQKLINTKKNRQRSK